MENETLNLDELNRAWGDLLAQLVVSRLAIQKQFDQLKIAFNATSAENEKLKAELSQLKLELLALQGKQIIDDGD